MKRPKDNEQEHVNALTLHTSSADDKLVYVEHYEYTDTKAHALDDDDEVLSRDMTKREALDYIERILQVKHDKHYITISVSDDNRIFVKSDDVHEQELNAQAAINDVRQMLSLVEYKAYDAESSFDAEANMITAFLRDCLKLAQRKYKQLVYIHLACDACTSDVLADDDIASTCVVITKEKPNEPYASWGNARVF